MIPAASLPNSLWKCFPNSGEGEPSGLVCSLAVLLKAPRSDSAYGHRFPPGQECPSLVWFSPISMLDALENPWRRDPEPAGITP